MSVNNRKSWTLLRERLINFYPPLLGAGIRSKTIDTNIIQVDMKLTALNRNIVGTHFGGSLYAMCDPWFMLILMRALGPDYVVWDKAAYIQFLLPGRGKVHATFEISEERIDQIRKQTEGDQKIEPTFEADVLDEDNQVVAHVQKLLYIRKKKQTINPG
jgi:acyl-coenzyme A thioesterase PaaI-like protein